MSRAHHPAGRARTLPCGYPGCGQPSRARVVVAHPQTAPHPFVTVLPLDHPGGVPACLDCAHTAVDVMLIKAMPERTR